MNKNTTPKNGLGRRSFLSRTALVGAAGVAGPALLSGCSGDDENAEVTGGEDYTPGSAELTVEIAPEIDGINYPDGYVGPKARELEPFGDGETEFTILSQVDPDMDMATNYYSGLVAEKTGVNAKYVTVPAGDDGKTKVNAIVAGGDLPHALMVGQGIFNISEISVYGEQGLFLPLDKLIDENAPHILDMFESFPDMRKQYTSPGGMMYAVPSMNDCYHCKSAQVRTWINSDWMEGVGQKEQPQTLDEFDALLEEFAGWSDLPDGAVLATSDADNMEFLFQFFLGSFLDVPSMYTRLNGGKVEFVQSDPAFREGIIWIQDQFKKKHFDAGIFSNTSEQYQKLGDASGGPKFGIAYGYSTFSFAANSDYADPENVALIMKPLAPMEGPSGVRTAAWDWYAYGYPNFVITPECSDPVQMIRWADYQFELGLTIAVGRGEQGTGWDYSDKGAEGIDGRQAIYKVLPTPEDLKNQAWREWGPLYKSSDQRLGEEVDKESQTVEPILYDAGKLYEPYASNQDYSLPTLVYTIDQAAQQGEISTNLSDAFKQAMADFGTGKKDASNDADWDAYISSCTSIGSDSLVELQQAAYDEQYG
jgi:putative aldouronate transport system substrate-binding protein